MTHYDLLVTPTNGHFEATVIGLPAIHAQAPTRQEAIDQAKKAAIQLLAKSEFVEIELELLPTENSPTENSPTKNSLSELGGMWKNNELFDEFIDAINTNRREVDTLSG